MRRVLAEETLVDSCPFAVASSVEWSDLRQWAPTREPEAVLQLEGFSVAFVLVVEDEDAFGDEHLPASLLVVPFVEFELVGMAVEPVVVFAVDVAAAFVVAAFVAAASFVAAVAAALTYVVAAASYLVEVLVLTCLWRSLGFNPV